VSWPLVLLVALLAGYLVLIGVLLLAGRSEQARAVARLVPDCIVFLTRIARNPCVPRGRALVLAGLVAYLASPIDLVPDFIPGLGQLDDALLVVLALRWALRGCPRAAIQAAWPGSASSLRMLLALTRAG
jgi:uncharacterized membrane protein YkvA (DUF1232 family)